MDFSKLNKIGSYDIGEDLHSWITVQPLENDFTDENISAEQDDNSFDYESRKILNHIDNNIFIHSDNGVGLTKRPEVVDENSGMNFVISNFIRRKTGKKKKPSDYSIDLAGIGGSLGMYQIGIRDYVGFKISGDTYIIGKFNYEFDNQNFLEDDIHNVSKRQFMNHCVGISVDFYSVGLVDFLKLHGQGGEYTGFFDKINLYSDLGLNFDFYKIRKFTRRRFNNTDVSINFKIGDNTGSNNKLYLPVFGDNLVTTIEDMIPSVNQEDDVLGNFHKIKDGDKEYHISVYYTDVIPPENSAEFEDFKNRVGEDNVFLWDSKGGDRSFPTIDVLGPNRVRLFEIGLYSEHTRTWDSRYNYRKLVIQILPSSPDNPSGRDKTKISDTKFQEKIKTFLRKLVLDMGWEHKTKGTVHSSQEKNEVSEIVKILQDDTHPLHSNTLLNMGRVLDRNVDTLDSSWKEDLQKVYPHNLDLVHQVDENDKYDLLEFQIDVMDDYHYTEFLARIQMETPDHMKPFRTMVWVHGGENDNHFNKLKTNIRDYGNTHYKVRGVERIVVIDKKDLTKVNGWKNMKVFDLTTK